MTPAIPDTKRTLLYADPEGKFLPQLVLASCRGRGEKTAIIDASCIPPRRISYAEYCDLVEQAARGLVASGVRPGDRIGIFLPNSWEFGVGFHAAMLAGAVPTSLNPTYREREVRYQLEACDAVALITDGALLQGISLTGLTELRNVFTTRQHCAGSRPFDKLLQSGAGTTVPTPDRDPRLALATLPFSSGTTGLPKGVMLTHHNIVANVYQTLTHNEAGAITDGDTMLCFLPMYHIYGLTIGLNLSLIRGCTLVLMPRFDCDGSLSLLEREGVTLALCVPPALLAYCHAAEQGKFPKEHCLKWVKCGAAPLAGELARRFQGLTGVPIRQGYGMTEASPVTHMGFLDTERYRPESVGAPVVLTDCRVVDETGNDVPQGELGELVMRGPQFMLGYWKSPEASDAVLRDGWYWSGDVVRVDEQGQFYVVDRRKEMMKYKGFSIAPAEVESVLLEHPGVRDCGVVSRVEVDGAETPCAFVVVREGELETQQTASAMQAFVAERLCNYKMPREIHFVPSIPRTPSGKILRRELRNLF
jgi:acyl-CoA synthetase (AMP-forming)/AMP-acid ligase II